MGGGDNTAAMEEVSQTDTGDVVTINIRCSNGSKFSVQINLDSSVDSFKTVLARNCDIPADQQRLIYKGRILKEDQTLRSYGTSIHPLFSFFNHLSLFISYLIRILCSFLSVQLSSGAKNFTCF